MLLLLDNYDSFTYNLKHYVEQFAAVEVFRNDEISVEECGRYDGVIFSPGPGLPEDAGLMMEMIAKYATSKPMLGVCLGMQAIGLHFGVPLRNLERVLHGKQSVSIKVADDPLLESLPTEFEVGHYHSWVLDEKEMNSPLEVTSVDRQGLIMSVKHESLPIHGVQFHPESVLTPLGKRMIENFVKGVVYN